MKNNLIRLYSTKFDFTPSSRTKIFRKRNNKPSTVVVTQTQHVNQRCNDHNEKTTGTIIKESVKTSSEYFENYVKVQMLSKNLYNQIFGKNRQNIKDKNAESLVNNLRKFGIDIDSVERIEDVILKLPPLKGSNIEEHFYNIAKEQIEPYEKLLYPLVDCEVLPKRPKKWSYTVGWTMYDIENGKATVIDYPKEDGLVLDVEVCISEGGHPILATAVSTKHWYSWCSGNLINDTNNNVKHISSTSHRYSLDLLMPLGKHGPKLVVGHNVSYDRARLREQYLLEDTKVRFIDTMSLHVCISGITSYQRAMLKSKKPPSSEDSEWMGLSSLNSLVDVHSLYCGNEPISKEARNIFVEGTLSDVRENFHGLMNYCAGDVEATHRILRVICPMFKERFPHPVSLAGMLEMGSAYLPVNSNWLRYIRESDLTYEDLSIEAKYHLSRRADEACTMLKDSKYRQNLWLWDEDWSTQDLKMKQPKRSAKSNFVKISNNKLMEENESLDEKDRLRRKFQHLYEKKSCLPARRPLLPGYPAWYRKLCQKIPKTTDECDNWLPGATEISTGMQIAPKLLALCWEGYPLYYLKEHGWGFLIPFCTEHNGEKNFNIPIEKLIERCPVPEFISKQATSAETEYAMTTLHGELNSKLSKRDFYTKVKKDNTSGQYQGSGIWCNKIMEDCCYFFKLPHKNGPSLRVGNPLSRDFLNKFSENVLSSGDLESNSASRVIEIARMMSYWRNNRDRIKNQMVVWLPPELSANHSKNSNNNNEYGAICPQVVTCGTLTRRAMEPTWMTASNSQRERIGSELRSMVQAPKSYRIVGADVDSQELWIASVLGDAYAHGMHGATPLGWMTLGGTKSNGTDMHSVTAKAVGISRDHAKVINYARIYGAGQNFAEGLLKQFNPTFSSAEAKKKSTKMFEITKGKRIYKIREEFLDEYDDRNYSSYEARKIAVSGNRSISEMFYKPCWIGGTESAMFNRLEEIALGELPVTPFLNCRLSRALETNYDSENRFLPTRVNWVVQSGAVDFLHLMLVAMRWLMGPHVRFCLSFHDELRYLVKEEMAYKAALAMHITNLLTRSFCSSRIGLSDLPMSVAFFSSVEVDTVLRKESTMDCKTPSNPHGLQIGYGIPPGESLNISEAIQKAGGIDLTQWKWIK